MENVLRDGCEIKAEGIHRITHFLRLATGQAFFPGASLAEAAPAGGQGYATGHHRLQHPHLFFRFPLGLRYDFPSRFLDFLRRIRRADCFLIQMDLDAQEIRPWVGSEESIGIKGEGRA